MIKTVSIKLKADGSQKDSLLRTMFKFNEICNYISIIAFEKKTFNKVNLQKEVYNIVRKEFNTPSQLTLHAIRRVCNSYKINKDDIHKFKKYSSVEYDVRMLTWKNLEQVSLCTLEKRITLPIVFGKYALLTEKNISCSAKLVYKKGIFYLNTSVEYEEAAPIKSRDFIGVDMGMVNLATTSDGEFFSGKEVENVRVRTNSLRKRLQRRGTKSAKRKLKKISKRERNFKKNTNHVISKRLVSTALKAQKGISLELLKNFSATVTKEQRDRFGKWAFAELTSFIIYKAQGKGVRVMLVDPRNTSRTCPQCGHCSKKNRKSQSEFVCKSCSYANHADIVGAINVRNRAVLSISLLYPDC